MPVSWNIWARGLFCIHLRNQQKFGKCVLWAGPCSKALEYAPLVANKMGNSSFLLQGTLW